MSTRSAADLPSATRVRAAVDAPLARLAVVPREQPGVGLDGQVRDSPGCSSTRSKPSRRMRASPAASVK
jgi:hypothetical protein